MCDVASAVFAGSGALEAEVGFAAEASGACSEVETASVVSDGSVDSGAIERESVALYTAWQRPQRTQPCAMRSWSATILNDVPQLGQWVTKCIGPDFIRSRPSSFDGGAYSKHDVGLGKTMRLYVWFVQANQTRNTRTVGVVLLQSSQQVLRRTALTGHACTRWWNSCSQNLLHAPFLLCPAALFGCGLRLARLSHRPCARGI